MSISELVTATPDEVLPHVTVNGQARALGEVGGHVTLLEWLRGSGFTGSKEGCAEGECGACAVLVARPDGDATRWTAINACLVPAAGLDQQEVITAEGIGQPDRLHPVQQQMADRGGSQCGYCTPGFICSMASEFYRSDRRSTQRRPRAGGGAQRQRERRRHEMSRATARTPMHLATHPTTSTARTASTCTRCPETCAGAPDIDRSGMRPTRWVRRTRQIRCWPGSIGRRRPRRPRM